MRDFVNGRGYGLYGLELAKGNIDWDVEDATLRPI